MKLSRGLPHASLLVLLAFAAYLPALRGGFVWDDELHLTANPAVSAPDGLRRIWSIGGTPQYYPLTFTTFRLEHRLWGLRPAGYHAVNVLLHALNALLAWLALRALAVPGAWLAAAVFALHPLNVESVAWITQRKNVLSGLFYLLSLNCYLRFEERGGRRWRWAALGSFLLALLSKTAVCTLPVALLLLRWRRGLPIGRKDLRNLAPFFAAAALLGLVTIYVESGLAGAHGPQFHLTFAQRLLAVGRAPWFYALKLAWPANLAFNYERWPLDASDPAQWSGAIALLAAAALVWRFRDRLGRGAVASLVFFLLTLAPALGFVSIYYHRYSFVADHYQYLAGLGLIALFVGGVARFVPAAALAALLPILGALTWRQTRIYRDSDALWADTLRKNPKSFLAHNNLGLSLAARGRREEAIAHYREAALIDPLSSEARSNLGLALAQEGRLEDAIAQYRAALRLAPEHPDINNNLGLALAGRRRLPEAAAYFRRALLADPAHVEARSNLGVALAALGRLDEAIAHYHAALELDPRHANARASLRLALAAKQRGGGRDSSRAASP